ncbi:MAG: alcohol dehydrogenase catalytic domain-containing protein, partial [Candidatus Dormibacteraceae bacterium]
MRYVEVSPGEVRLRDGPPSELPAGSARVRVLACGVCGSDAHLARGMVLPHGTKYPVRPGHEVAGVVVEVAAGVNAIAVGDDVVLHPLDPCGVCRACLAGRDERCHAARVLGIQAPGGMAEEVVWPARRMVGVPGLPASEAAVLPDAVATAHHAVRVAGLPAEGLLCVIGAGGVGSHAIRLARVLHPEVRVAAVVRSEAGARRLAEQGVHA